MILPGSARLKLRQTSWAKSRHNLPTDCHFGWGPKCCLRLYTASQTVAHLAEVGKSSLPTKFSIDFQIETIVCAIFFLIKGYTGAGHIPLCRTFDWQTKIMAFCFMAYLGVKNILRLGIDNVSASFFTIDIRECLPGTVLWPTLPNKNKQKEEYS